MTPTLMCVNLLHKMKNVTLRQMQHHLSEVIRQVDHGQEVLVTRRRRVVARLVPVRPPPAGRPRWPDFVRRAGAVRLRGASLTQTVRTERDA